MRTYALLFFSLLVSLPGHASHSRIWVRLAPGFPYREVAPEQNLELFRTVRFQSTAENALVCYEGMHSAQELADELAYKAEAEKEGVRYTVRPGTENEFLQPIRIEVRTVEPSDAEARTFVMPHCE